MRDTDKDWINYGNSEPYFGVLAHERFLRRNLTEEALEEFWNSGRQNVDHIWSEVKRVFGDRSPPKAALDFGCGVGRLTRAMAEIAETATGVDVSEGMIAEARARALHNMTYTLEMPQGQFDWINSYIVFQHIHPDRGYELLDELLRLAAPQCVLTLHFSIFKDARGFNDHGLNSMAYGTWDGQNIKPLVKRDIGHAMMMYDYDMTRLFAMLVANGFSRSYIIHEDHAGAHTAWFFAVR